MRTACLLLIILANILSYNLTGQTVRSEKSTIILNTLGKTEGVHSEAEAKGMDEPENSQIPVNVEGKMPDQIVVENSEIPLNLTDKENQIQTIKGIFYALIVGINEYEDPSIFELDKPVSDAENFYNVITRRYTFDSINVKLLKDASIADLVGSLDFFARLVRPEDNFLIFYAGHGVWDKSSEIGYWLPSDAKRNSKLEWFRNSTLRDYLREIKSRHTLLISDACFGGSIFKTRNAFRDASAAINKLYELPSRKAMTSGTLTEVPDESAFIKYLLDRLETNTEKYLPSEQLFSSFRLAVINNSNVVPQFGEIRDVGDEGGDFIFMLRE